MLFIVPGGSAAAIFSGALLTFDRSPGPRFVSDNPDLTYPIIWSVSIAPVVAAVI